MDQRQVKLVGRGDVKSLVQMETCPIKLFVHWFQTISANLDVKTQKEALNACREVAFSLLATQWYDEGKSDIDEAAPAQSDTRRAEYSTKIGEVGYPHQSQDKGSNRDSVGGQ